MFLKIQIVSVLWMLLASYNKWSFAAVTQQDLNDICADKSLIGLTHPEDEHKYIVCFNNIGVEKICPLNKCFSETEQICNDQCSEDTENQDYKDSINGICQEPSLLLPPGTTLPAEDCSHFYICLGQSQQTIRLECPSNMEYSKQQNACLPAGTAGCGAPICNSNNNGHYFKHSDCTKFYVCINSTPFEAQCEHGYYFIHEQQLCIRGQCPQ